MNKNEQMIREQAYELWDHAGRPDSRSDEFLTVRCETEILNAERHTLARMFPRMWRPSRHGSSAD